MKNNLVVPVFFLLGFASLAFLSIRKIPDSISTTVKTTEGMVRGIRGKTGILSFKGIPFAMPPIGELRWKAPQAMHLRFNRID